MTKSQGTIIHTMLVLLIFLLASCGEAPAVTQPIPTASATPDVGALSTQVVATVYAAAKTSSAPSITPTQPTPTATYVPPVVRFDSDSNCRSGPGIKFPLLEVLKAGQTAEPLGYHSEGKYWVVKYSQGNEGCWVVADFVTPSGSIETLPNMTLPPTYTPEPAPAAPKLTTWDYSCEFANEICTVTLILEWQDLANNETGYSIFRNNELVANLSPNAITYTDIIYLGRNQAATYFVQAYNFDGAARSADIKIVIP